MYSERYSLRGRQAHGRRRARRRASAWKALVSVLGLGQERCFYRGWYSAGVTWRGRFPEVTYTCPGDRVSDRLCVLDQ